MSADIEKILSICEIDYNITDRRIFFSCPFHPSSKSDSLSILLDTNVGQPIWKCWTNGCEQKYGKTLNGLIKGLSKIYKKNLDTINIDIDQTKTTFNSIIAKPYQEKLLLRVEELEGKLVPSTYFMNRFSPEILAKYNVGSCTDKYKPMYNRSVVPVFNDTYTHMVGCIGRSELDICQYCDRYHLNKCPKTSLEFYLSSKWINSSHFDARYYLYNWWFAYKSILEKSSVILVEGPPDVWRFAEANIYNVLGLFGTALKSEQLLKLNSIPISTIYLGLNSDTAGTQGTIKLKEELSRYYNIKELICPKKDWAQLTKEELTEYAKSTFNFR